MKDPSAAIWIAASIRMEIERLQDAAQRADEAQLPKVSADLEELALQAAKIYEKLIKLASPASQPTARKQRLDSQELPF